ncbi:Mitochondrial substrate carrier family protein E [Linum perenne]
MASPTPTPSDVKLHSQQLLASSPTHNHFFVWREFLWGAIAGAFGEGMMHPIDTVKTRIQSQAIFNASQVSQKSVLQMVRSVWVADGLRGFYRGVTPSVTGSLATGATYFGFIESTKKWIESSHPGLGGNFSYFIAGALGDTVGSVVYVPCEVVKQRMQVQGTKTSWTANMLKESSTTKRGNSTYGYYTGMFQAGSSILKEQGPRGLFTGYGSTLARDMPFAGLMVMSYETLKDLTEYGRKTWSLNLDEQLVSSMEGLVLGGVSGGLSAYLTTPLDVIKTRLQVQGSTIRYKGWLDAIHKIWMIEGVKGLFKGSIPRITWYIPASALTFMAVESLRGLFNKEEKDDTEEVTSLSIEKKATSLPEVS